MAPLRCFVFAALLLLSLASPIASVVIPANFTDRLDAWVQCMLTSPYLAPQPPELTLSIVANGATLFAKGYGKDAQGRAITERTLFGIGSVSKAFTSTLMGQLMNQSILHYDTPLSHFPSTTFTTYSPYIDAHANLRDLLTHHTGLSRADFIAIASSNSTSPWRRFVSSTLARLPPAVDFREYWLYNNFAVGEAARMLEQIAGQGTWEEMVQRMLTALGMTDTQTSAVAARLSGRMATPYTAGSGARSGVVQLADDVDDWVDLVKPAGAIFSSALDMAEWIKYHLGYDFHGMPVDLTTIHSPQVTSAPPSDALYLPNTVSMSQASLGYGFGWETLIVDGHQMVTHSGSTLGFWSFLELYPQPDDSFGIFLSAPAVSAEVENLIALWVDLELLGHENYLARLPFCPQVDPDAGPEREGDAGLMETALAARVARHQPERDLLLPLTLRSKPSAEVAALHTATAPLTAVDPAQLVGVYTNTRGGAWGQLRVELNQSSTAWPLTLRWESLVALIRPTPNLTVPCYDAQLVAPLHLVPLFPQLRGVFCFDVNDTGVVRGVRALLDEPVPYFALGGGGGGGEPGMMSSSSTGGGGGGGDEPAETKASGVLLTTALSIVSLLLLAVVVYAVWITKKYKEAQSTNNPAGSDLNERLM